MHRACFYFHKISRQIAVFIVIFYFSDKIIVCRVIVYDNRRSLSLGIVDNKVYPIFKRYIFCLCSAELWYKCRYGVVFIGFIFCKLIYILQNVFLNRFQIFYNPFAVLIFFLKRAYIMTYSKHSDLIIKIVHLLFVFFINRLYITHDGINIILNKFKSFINTFFYIFGQIVVIFLINRFAVNNRLKNYPRI